MPDFGSLYGLPGGAPDGGFDIIGPNAGAQQQRGSPVFNTVPLQGQGGQPQGAPVSGLLAGMMGLPTTGGAVPGAAYLAQGQGQGVQPQPYGGSPLMAGLLGLPRYGGPAQGGAVPAQDPAQADGQMQPQRLLQLLQAGGPQAGGQAAAQPQNNLARAVGTGVRSLFDGMMGG